MDGTTSRRCDGVTRRDVLRVGCLGGVSLSQFFHLTTLASRSTCFHPAKSCILIWLDGGPSHLETFDPKPEAPAEVRGPFQPINTVVPGMQLSELLPLTAQVADKIAIIRAISSPLGEHGLANHYLLTGYKPSPVLEYPSFGSVHSWNSNRDRILPSYVAIPEAGAAGAGFLGADYQPFSTGGDPSRPEFKVRDLDFFPSIDETRINRRRKFLAELDALQASVEKNGKVPDGSLDKAFRLMTSTKAKQAFDLNQESSDRRTRYGSRMIGQSCLLARRLVESGIPFVTVFNSGWDTHENLKLNLRDGYAGAKVGVGLVPSFDQAFSALISDLAESGLLDETLVIAMGEFGRTPKVNTRGGRDHWPRAFSVALAGGGIRGGQVIGASDFIGESPQDEPWTPTDLARSIYTLLGVDCDREMMTADQRPVPVNQNGRLISSLCDRW